MLEHRDRELDGGEKQERSMSCIQITCTICIGCLSIHRQKFVHPCNIDSTKSSQQGWMVDGARDIVGFTSLS